MKGTKKYLKDGRKVMVVGKVSEGSWIVQEIYVDAQGGEFPQGNNFVVKELLDVPALTWHQKRLRDIEGSYEKDKKKLEAEIEKKKGILERKLKVLKARIGSIEDYLEVDEDVTAALLESALEDIKGFLTGRFKYFVKHDWRYPKLEKAENLDDDFWFTNKKKDPSMRLISLYGRSGGDLQWNIHEYGSHGGSRKIVPFETLEDALDCWVDTVNERDIGEDIIKEAKSLGVYDRLDPEKIKDYYNLVLRSAIDDYNHHQDKVIMFSDKAKEIAQEMDKLGIERGESNEA